MKVRLTSLRSQLSWPRRGGRGRIVLMRHTDAPASLRDIDTNHKYADSIVTKHQRSFIFRTNTWNSRGLHGAMRPSASGMTEWSGNSVIPLAFVSDELGRTRLKRAAKEQACAAGASLHLQCKPLLGHHPDTSHRCRERLESGLVSKMKGFPPRWRIKPCEELSQREHQIAQLHTKLPL